MACLAMGDHGQAALMHFIAAHAGCLIYRSKLRGGGLFFEEDFAATRLELDDGGIALPDGVSVGIEIDGEKVARHAIASRRFDT
jgi:L-alanine-DL-glutamate epimerase-like enolase superfamily enzyme